MGSRLTKSFIDSSLVGPGSTALMSGIFFGDGRQHIEELFNATLAWIEESAARGAA